VQVPYKYLITYYKYLVRVEAALLHLVQGRDAMTPQPHGPEGGDQGRQVLGREVRRLVQHRVGHLPMRLRPLV
jgi:hypothetical protein